MCQETVSHSGTVFDVERFSAKDGPGIRTVVFLMGCNLNCRWCHNAEGICSSPQLGYDAERCIGCGQCLAVCPMGAHRLTDGKHLLDRTCCTGCFRCTEVCFSGALKRIGRCMTVAELMPMLLEDSAYYRNSGGGVTLSGGECMCQQDFVLALLKQLKAQGIHTALETNLAFPPQDYEKVFPYADLIMADVKTSDRTVFERYIGQSFDRVKENLQMLAAGSKPFLIRTPVIGGVNDSPAEIGAIAHLLRGSPSLLYYELLTYHPLGISKARLIGRDMKCFTVPTRDCMAALAHMAADEGLHVLIDGHEIDAYEGK